MNSGKGSDFGDISQIPEGGLQHQGDYEQIVTRLDKMLAVGASGAEPYTLLQEILDDLTSGQKKARKERLLETVLEKRSVALGVIRLALSEGRRNEALDWSSRLLEQNPDDMYTQSLAYRAKDDYQQALAVADQLVRTSPNIPNTYNWRAEIDLAAAQHESISGLSEKAIQYYRRAIGDLDQTVRLAPPGLAAASTYLVKGQVRTLLQEYDKARVDFEDAIKLDHNNISAHAFLGDSFAALGDKQAGEGSVAVAEQDYSQAIASYDKAVQLALKQDMRAEAAHLYFVRGATQARLVDYDKAIDDYTKALELDPNLVDAYYYRGVLHKSRQEYEQALQDFGQEIKRNPKSIRAYSERGNLYVTIGGKHAGEGQDDKAHEYYHKAIDDFNVIVHRAPAEPAKAPAYLSRGQAWAQLQEFDKAIDDCKKALELDPKLVDAHYTLGLLYEDRQQYKQALKEYQNVVDLARDSPLAYRSRADVQAALGPEHYQDAIASYTKAIEVDRTYTDAYLGRARVYALQQADEKAIADYTEALKLNPDLVEAYYFRGVLNQALGKYQDALQDYSFLIMREPNQARGYIVHGDVLISLGDYEGAVRDYEHALELDEENVDVRFRETVAYFGLGDQYQDQRLYDKASASYQQALEDCDKALKTLSMDPDNPLACLAHQYRGQAYRALVAYDASVESFDRALELAKPEIIPKDALAELHGHKGESLRLWGEMLGRHDEKFKQAKLKEAVRELSYPLEQPANRGATNLLWIHNARGKALIQLQRYREALSAFNALIHSDATHGWAHIGKGKVHHLRHEFPQAQRAFEHVLTLNTDDRLLTAWALVGLGLALTGLNASPSPEAEQAYDKASQVLRDSDMVTAFLDRANIFEDFEEYKLAQDDYQNASKQDPNQAEAYNSLAWLLVELLPDPERSQLEEAADLARKAIGLQSTGLDYAYYLDTLGWAYFRLRRYSEAYEHLVKSARLRPGDVAKLQPYSLLVRSQLQQAEAALGRLSNEIDVGKHKN